MAPLETGMHHDDHENPMNRDNYASQWEWLAAMMMHRHQYAYLSIQMSKQIQLIIPHAMPSTCTSLSIKTIFIALEW